jgi:acetyltransferase-like isoleucine patch superfamily enzyme
MRSARLFILLMIAVLPWLLKKPLLKYFYGFSFGQGSWIGFTLIDCRNVTIGANCSIGSFTIIRNLEKLVMEENSRIGTFNWIFGYLGHTSFEESRNRESALILRNDSAITSRHIFDCIDRIEIGAFSTVAGFRTQLLTHSIDLKRNIQSCAPIIIGSYCFIGTSVVVLKGVKLPDYSVLAAGTVMNRSPDDGRHVFAGSPAKPVREVDNIGGYFSRKQGRVN